MQGFHLSGDLTRLYFTNYERRTDIEELDEILSVLNERKAEQLDHVMGPDCDLYKYKVSGVEFDLIHSIDGDGSFLYCDTVAGMKLLESFFDMKE